ncbi:MAG: hypothetical protein EBW67_05265 [Actinobacteria bacterium]|nr:hypothetical protein [Actinomycetota bacterium]
MLRPERTSRKTPNLPPITPYSAMICRFVFVGSATTTEPLALSSGWAIMRQSLSGPLGSSTSASNGTPPVSITASIFRLDRFGTVLLPPVDETSPRNWLPSASKMAM